MDHTRFLSIDHPWRRNKSAFDRTQKFRLAPQRFSGDDVLKKLDLLQPVTFGKTQAPPEVWNKINHWKLEEKKHIFQVTLLESTCNSSLLGCYQALLEKRMAMQILITWCTSRKTNGNVNDRLDLQASGIRISLHPVCRGTKLVLPPTCFSLSKQQKITLCNFVKNLRLRSGYSPNISHCVKMKDRKLIGLKRYDQHVLMQRILSVAIKGLLPKHVWKSLIDMSNTF